MLAQNLAVSQAAIAHFCHKHHIRKLALFGSVLGDKFSSSSDVDVLVEFEEGHVPGFAFFDMQDELTALLGRQVDLHTPRSLSRYFREQVLTDAVVLYEDAQYAALVDELDDLDSAPVAQVALENWRKNPSSSRLREEVKAELHKCDEKERPDGE